jgi:hypothetical protein
LFAEIRAVLRHCYPEFNDWLNTIFDPRRLSMCRYSGAHLWWAVILVFLIRGGSRNAFDALRNLGSLPENMQKLCAQLWDVLRLGEHTVTCSQNTIHHAGRIDPSEVEPILLKMIRRLMRMRMLDAGRLFNTWWRIAIDGTLQQRSGGKGRMVLEARLIGPWGIELPLMVEFLDMYDHARDKQDCELRGFDRLTRRLRQAFPRLSICLLLDGLYAVEAVFDRCKEYGWKYIISFKEGRQPTTFDEAVEVMWMSPLHLWKARRQGEDGMVDQTARWAEDVLISNHQMNVVFLGEIAPHAATLWAWATNFTLDAKRMPVLVNEGGRARQRHEESFNVLKNNGYGLEHAFCTRPNASKNYHLMLLVADSIWQLVAQGVLGRYRHLARKMTEVAFVKIMLANMLCVSLPPDPKIIGQIRFVPP